MQSSSATTSGEWSPWFNTDRPWIGTGDVETLRSIEEHYGSVCGFHHSVEASQCKLTEFGEEFTESSSFKLEDHLHIPCTDQGLLCLNEEQKYHSSHPTGECNDYAIRFWCTRNNDSDTGDEGTGYFPQFDVRIYIILAVVPIIIFLIRILWAFVFKRRRRQRRRRERQQRRHGANNGGGDNNDNNNSDDDSSSCTGSTYAQSPPSYHQLFGHLGSRRSEDLSTVFAITRSNISVCQSCEDAQCSVARVVCPKNVQGNSASSSSSCYSAQNCQRNANQNALLSPQAHAIISGDATELLQQNTNSNDVPLNLLATTTTTQTAPYLPTSEISSCTNTVSLIVSSSLINSSSPQSSSSSSSPSSSLPSPPLSSSSQPSSFTSASFQVGDEDNHQTNFTTNCANDNDIITGASSRHNDNGATTTTTTNDNHDDDDNNINNIVLARSASNLSQRNINGMSNNPFAISNSACSTAIMAPTLHEELILTATNTATVPDGISQPCPCTCHRIVSIPSDRGRSVSSSGFDNAAFSQEDETARFPGMHHNAAVPGLHRVWSNMSVGSVVTLSELPSYEDALELIKKKEDIKDEQVP